MSLTFLTVLRSGSVYSPVWVQRLCRTARTYLKPDRIVCLTDMTSGVTRGCFPESGSFDIWYQPLLHDWPGWFAKLELFRPGVFSGAGFYVDLDSLILRPIPRLEELITAAGSLLLLDDFFAPSRPASGVMAWTPTEQTERIYHEFVLRTRCAPGWQNGDGAIIGQYPHKRLQTIFPRAFQSWKVQQRKNQPVTGSVLCFHGKPKNCDFPAEHWITKTWEALA